ncbi:MAG: NAD(P)H-dependent oxidoreductase [Lachnospiraceae bacterium]|nr:NAD(P)H-dependent oxidoreductase [Lachnospiraceae bacterium]
MILFVNACVRKDSRTKRLADALLEELGGDVEEVKLWEEDLPLADEAFLAERDRLINAGDHGCPMFALARQFARADIIVMAAPYWDLSFPAVLKQYIEQINVLGITFEYTEDGFPKSLCRAEKLYYVMTAGGCYVPEEYGYGYVKELAGSFYGIRETRLIKALGLDIAGADPESILTEAISSIKGMVL